MIGGKFNGLGKGSWGKQGCWSHEMPCEMPWILRGEVEGVAKKKKKTKLQETKLNFITQKENEE